MAKCPPSLELDVDEVAAALARRAPEWLGRSDEGSCDVRSVRRRPQSVLVWARLASGPVSTDVVAKIPRAPTRPPARGRLFDPVADPVTKAHMEYATVSILAEEFSRVADPRWGWVEPVGLLPEMGVLVTGELTTPTLDEMLRARAPRPPSGPKLEVVMSHLGAWLARFQRLDTPHAVPRDASADQLAASLSGLLLALRDAGRQDHLPAGIEPFLTRFESGVPLGALRTGLGHGDFAPRNVFVGHGGRVTPIDSLGRFRVPVQEDLAYLLVELALGANRYARRGPPRSSREVARLRAALLEGHGTDDDAVLWFFELRALLDKWRSLAQRPAPSGIAGLPTVVASSIRERLIARRVNTLAERLGAAW